MDHRYLPLPYLPPVTHFTHTGVHVEPHTAALDVGPRVSSLDQVVQANWACLWAFCFKCHRDSSQTFSVPCWPEFQIPIAAKTQENKHSDLE